MYAKLFIEFEQFDQSSKTVAEAYEFYEQISTNNRLSIETSGIRMFAMTLFRTEEENMDERATDAHPFCSTSG